VPALVAGTRPQGRTLGLQRTEASKMAALYSIEISPPTCPRRVSVIPDTFSSEHVRHARARAWVRAILNQSIDSIQMSDLLVGIVIGMVLKTAREVSKST